LQWPMAVVVPALVALAVVAIVWVGLHAYEFIRGAKPAPRHAC
jgi:hypothetical protein